MAELDENTPQLNEELDDTVLTVGTVIEERYRISEFLGMGGMGSVYRAKHLEFGRDAAIKILHARYTSDIAAVKRFQREARIISGLNHTNILSVYAFGGYKGFVYLAMEFVEGKSLAKLIAEKGTLKPDEALPLLLQICEGMAHAHKNEVLHRDLKPDNVMIVIEDNGAQCAKVVDFGLAKLQDTPDGQRLTKTGEVVGDPRYMAPEQCRGLPLDARSDLYSFGCLMYEVFTGLSPFESDDPVSIMQKQVGMDPEPFAQSLGLPPALEAITFNCMAKDRDERYDSFDEVGKLLRQVAADPNVKIAATATRHSGKKPLERRLLATVIAVVCVGALALTVALSTDLSVLPMKLKMQSGSDQEKMIAALSLAEHYELKKDQDQALIWYDKASQLAAAAKDQKSILISFGGKGRILCAKQRRHEAIPLLQQAAMAARDLVMHGNTDPQVYDATRAALLDYEGMDAVAPIVTHEIAAGYLNSHKKDWAVGILKTVPDSAPKAVRSTTQFILGELCLEEGNKKEALQYFERAIEIADVRYNRFCGMRTIAGACIKNHENQLALEYRKRALKEVEQTTQYDLIALIYQEVAEAELLVKDIKAANAEYVLAVAAARKVQPSAQNNAVLAKSLHGLAHTQYHSGDRTGAEKTYREEIALLKKQPQLDKPALAQALILLGDTLTLENRVPEAAVSLQQAVDVIDSAGHLTPELQEARRTAAQKLSQMHI